MQNAPVIVATNLDCQHCGWPLIKDGKFKCHRCKQETELVLGKKAIFCHYCRKPRILLAKHNLALCPQCRKETLIQKSKEVKMERKDIIWQAFIGKNPTNDELYRIIYNAPEEYKAKASEQLLKQNPTNDELRRIIYYAPEEYKAKAREIQEIRDKNKDELLKLMLKE